MRRLGFDAANVEAPIRGALKLEAQGDEQHADNEIMTKIEALLLRVEESTPRLRGRPKAPKLRSGWFGAEAR